MPWPRRRRLRRCAGRPPLRIRCTRGSAPTCPAAHWRRHGAGHRRAEVPHDRPDDHGRAGRGPGGRRGRSPDLLRGGRDGGRVEDGKCRDHVHARFQGRSDRFRRRRDRGAVEPERGLGRDRRAEQPAEFAVGQRCLPFHRCRAHMDACGTGEYTPHCAHPGASARSRPGLRGSGRPPVGSEPRAGRIPHHRRRRDLGTRSASSTTTPARPN